MTNARFAVLVVLGLIFVGIGLSAFTVNEREHAIKLQVGQKLTFDPKSEKFVDNAAANKLLTRKPREGFAVPEKLA